MLPRNHPDRIQITFDDRRLVANAGLLLPATLARHLGLPELVRQRLDLGDAPGRANTSDKMMTLVASALAGGDCIDDADVLRTGGTACTLGGTVKAPSTLGTFLRSFRWGHVRQLDRVSRELLARAWQAGAGPGDGPLTIDLDSTICETYGLAKEGARHHGYTGKRGYHPLLAIAAGTGDVLMSRLREGRANTARGAAHFLRETVGRVRYAGANGRLTLRADSGFYTHGVVSVCRKMDVRFSITIRQHKSLRNLIEAIPEDAWTPIPYWMDGAADVAETTCTPFQSEPDAAPVRLIVRRVKPTPGSQLALFAKYSYHGFITDRDGELLELEAASPRRPSAPGAGRTGRTACKPPLWNCPRCGPGPPRPPPTAWTSVRRSITQSLKLERNPWGTAGIPSRRSRTVKVMGDASLPLRAEGNTRPSPSPKRDASPSISIALPDSGTRWGRLAFIRVAGISQVVSAQLISPHSAPRTSPDRLAVSIRNSKASLVGLSAVDSLTSTTASGTWA